MIHSLKFKSSVPYLEYYDFFKAVTLPIDNQYVIPFNNSLKTTTSSQKKKVTHTVRKSSNCVQIFNFHFSGKITKLIIWICVPNMNESF